MAVRLGFRPPYDGAAMLGFFARRALGGVESVTGTGGIPQLARTLRVVQGEHVHAGWLQLRFDLQREQVLLRVGDSLAAVLPIVISRVRAMLDLDAEPMAINSALHASFPQGDGLRVPGTVDGFELAVRAVLGQQITVAAARTLGTRLVQAFGEAIATPVAGLERLFPTPAAIAGASGDALGQLGIVRQRQAALSALAREVQAGRLALHAGADVPATLAALQALPGIGDWTAQYIAMRALRWPDAFPAGDVALQKALGVSSARAAHRGLAGLAPLAQLRGAARVAQSNARFIRCRCDGSPSLRTAMKFKNTTLYSTYFESPLGRITLAATDAGLAGVWFDQQRHWPDTRGWQPDAAHPVLREAAAQLADYFAGMRQHFDLPLDLSHGTGFQQAVWQALLAIPAGRTTSYGALSAGIGKPAAVRAVGAAVGRNPISVIVPCHRVLGTNGSLTGYAGGLERKSALLELEGVL